MKHLKLILSLSLILFTFLSSIPKITASPKATASVKDSGEEQTDAASGDTMKNGLQFRLSEGKGQPQRQPVGDAQAGLNRHPPQRRIEQLVHLNEGLLHLSRHEYLEESFWIL